MNFLTGFGFDMPPRPTKRRAPLPETYVFQLRIDLVGARPPIWRRIEIRSDVNLLTLHRVLQGAFDWWDAHLYRFSLGDPYSWESELFLCDFDITDGEDEGTFVGDVRLDETLQKPGDQLDYLYDYGDSWHHKIKLEKVRVASPDDPVALCTAGRRAAPPDDSGGIVDGEFLAEVLDDPSHFDLDLTNEVIGSWLVAPGGFAPSEPITGHTGPVAEDPAEEQRFPQFRHILDHCVREESYREITARLHQLHTRSRPGSERPLLDDSERFDSLSAVHFALEEIRPSVTLTGAGYLPPKIAVRIGEELSFEDHLMSSGGESKMLHVSHFRHCLQQAGLLRKRKGELLLTRAAKKGLEAPEELWNQLAAGLLPREPSGRSFPHDAALLSLLFATTSNGGFELEAVAQVLTDIGWRINNDPVQRHHVVFQASWQTILLWYIAPKEQRAWFSNTVSPAASELARAALLGMKPAYPM